MTVLVLCKNHNQCRSTSQAFPIENASYMPWYAALTAGRFERVIVMPITSDSAAEREALDRFIKERAPTLLAIGGKLHVL